MSESDRVVNQPDNNRYVLLRDDRVLGEAQYERADGVITFTHTETDPTLEERGLGTQLVASALDDVRENSDDRVVPQCNFVHAFIDRRPEYADLTTR